MTLPTGCQFEGSSPRMRGALSYEADPDQAQGIIPADAGSTGQGLELLVDLGDHPRGCGEHLAQVRASP